MWVKGILISQKKVNGSRSRRNSYITSIFFTIVLFVLIAAMLAVFTGQFQGYSPVASKCISCHNDTDYPNDTNMDGVAAPYKRPHNNHVMCESCHKKNPHTLVYIQASGAYGDKATAASCPDCHQTGIPPEVNSNFTSAFKISVPLRHSSDLSNGSVWGSYWINSTRACIFCHNRTLHDIAPVGRILEWYPEYKIYGSIGNNFTCAGCHYKGSSNYSLMTSNFAAAGLQIPPEITNGTNWNGTFVNYYNHTINNYTDETCKHCHGLSLETNASMAEFIHNLTVADMNACKECHPEVSSSDLGLHANFTGTPAVENSDCQTCHYGSFPMVKGAVNNSNTYYCADCHTTAGTGPKKSSAARRFVEKQHGEATCMECHVADGKFHQDNPRGSVANSVYVNRYTTANTNTTDCADCHYAANLDNAPFNAPGGGAHISNAGGTCETGGCHPGGSTLIQTMHSIDSLSNTNKPTISVPTLNSSSVLQGTDVNVTATVNYTGLYALVDGAQYRIMSGTTEIRSWTAMSALDGDFNGTDEVAVATIKTNISAGTYTIEVRGMAGGPAQNISIRYYPINGDVSAINSTNLTIQGPMGYINGTVTDGVSPLTGATVSITGSSTTTYSGLYSLMILEGTHDVTASKRPEYYDNITTGVGVISGNTTVQNFVLTIKPTGNITGIVTNATG